MNPLSGIVFCTFVIRLIEWVGSLILFVGEEMMDTILLVLFALSAGGQM